MVRTFIATCVMAALIGLTGGFIENTNASTFDRTTYYTFSQPVAIPGVTLPAGTVVSRRRARSVECRGGVGQLDALTRSSQEHPQPGLHRTGRRLCD